MTKQKNKIKNLDFTFNFQQQKLVEELLTEKYFSGFEGFVDVFLQVSNDNDLKAVETIINLLPVRESDKLAKNAIRFHIKQGAGYKLYAHGR